MKNSWIGRLMTPYGWYALLIILGFWVYTLLPPLSVGQALVLGGFITLTALFASFLVPFASFAQNERWQKIAFQYGMLPVFGLYAAVIYDLFDKWQYGLCAVFLFWLCPCAVHFSYWTAGIHSRAYRLEQFRLGFAEEMPKTARVIAILNGRGLSNLSDQMIKSILITEATLDLTTIRDVLAGMGGLMDAAENEMSRAAMVWQKQ